LYAAALGYRLDKWGSIPDRDRDFSLLPTTYRLTERPKQPPSLGIKQPGHETDHSAPSSAEIKNAGLNLHSPTNLHSMLN
jgi:hypothetical protein